jgi:elongation factor P--(R)-beta-lysine ligase
VLHWAGVDVDTASDVQLARAAERHDVFCDATLDRDGRLDLLIAMVVGPNLGKARPCFVHDYPASQASLARLKSRSSAGLPPIAARFEYYLEGLELANGFHELGDARQQRHRFEQDLATRRERCQPLPPVDERLLAALNIGFPDCAGVALGLDRLLAIALGASSLGDVLSFDFDRA